MVHFAVFIRPWRKMSYLKALSKQLLLYVFSAGHTQESVVWVLQTIAVGEYDLNTTLILLSS